MERTESVAVPSHTGRIIRTEIRKILSEEIKREVKALIRSRYGWKIAGDYVEALAKGIAGISSILAFAASAAIPPKTSDILAFTSGTLGTLGLVLLTYGSYASRESRQRTSELNTMLKNIGVTPLPEIASIDESAETV